jgi:CheY-like chemotaxis protein
MRSAKAADLRVADVDSICVLVVDDEPIIRDLLRAMLGNLGVATEVAENGVEAQKRILSGSYQLVITDINMPEMDGITFIKWLRKRKPEVEIVVMTGYDITEDMVKTIGDTATACFVKPPEQVKVRDMIELCREKNRYRT